MDNQLASRLVVVTYIIMLLFNIIIMLIAAVGVYKWYTTPHPKDPTIITEKEQAQIAKTQMDCLTANIFHEARGESPKGQEAVAWVTLNRVASKQYPKQICDVVKQKDQFSWYVAGTPIKINRSNIEEVKSWNKAQKIAAKVLAAYTDNHPDPTKGALFYHANYVNPYWADKQAMTASIGNHKFYSKALVTVASR